MAPYILPPNRSHPPKLPVLGMADPVLNPTFDHAPEV